MATIIELKYFNTFWLKKIKKMKINVKKFKNQIISLEDC